MSCSSKNFSEKGELRKKNRILINIIDLRKKKNLILILKFENRTRSGTKNKNVIKKAKAFDLDPVSINRYIDIKNGNIKIIFDNAYL
ncbi:hypothetical protein [Candidatus Pelagibacter sp. RS40]|uniref:hypothetical protein n=1 Tax=Candidatus Pelagibacter sp. RS40 TaxID=1977865 RepID=UPI0012ED8DDE|nr:hypothetical protein [Candidatus Pelagibacter sp. RS40]